MSGEFESPPGVPPDGPKDWEKLLAEEGLGELGEDEGKKALLEQMEAGDDVDPAVLAKAGHALRMYFCTRANAQHYDHKNVTDEIARSVGANPEDLSEAFVESVRDEMMTLSTSMGRIAQRIVAENHLLGRNPRRLGVRIVDTYLREHPASDLHEDVIHTMADTAAVMRAEVSY